MYKHPHERMSALVSTEPNTIVWLLPFEFMLVARSTKVCMHLNLKKKCIHLLKAAAHDNNSI